MNEKNKTKKKGLIELCSILSSLVLNNGGFLAHWEAESFSSEIILT